MNDAAYSERLRSQPLPVLRTLRESLQEEERRVSYWRLLIQGRLDLVRTARLTKEHPDPGDLARLAAVRERGGGARRSPASTQLTSSTNPLESVEALWAAPPPWDNPEELEETERQLVEAEVELSVYRRILHQRLDTCTAQLIERYQREPNILAELGADPSPEPL